MGKLSRKVFEDRAIRNAARQGFDSRVASVKADLAARGIGGRIADRASQQARDAYDEAMAVAAESKGIIAGTLAALAVWLLRGPIVASLDRLLGHDNDYHEEEFDDEA